MQILHILVETALHLHRKKNASLIHARGPFIVATPYGRTYIVPIYEGCLLWSCHLWKMLCLIPDGGHMELPSKFYPDEYLAEILYGIVFNPNLHLTLLCTFLSMLRVVFMLCFWGLIPMFSRKAH